MGFGAEGQVRLAGGRIGVNQMLKQEKLFSTNKAAPRLVYPAAYSLDAGVI